MKTLTLLYLLIFCLFLSSCQSKSNENSSRYFRYNQESGISSLDPAFAKDQATIWAANQLFNGLVQLNNSLEVMPCLAKSWQVSSNGLVYTFNLQSNVLFHDGTLLNANDVVYSLQRIINPAVASPGAWIFNGKVADTNPFIALNDTTFVLTLKQAFPPILQLLANQYCSIVSKAAVEKYGANFRANPVGTGAFKLKAWKENEVLILGKNTKYFEKDAQGKPLPYIDGVRVSFMENKRNAYLKFINGELDFLSGLDASYKDELINKNGELLSNLSSKINLLKAPYLNTEYLGFNLENTKISAIQKVKVRQALAYSIDKDKIINYLRNNIGKAANAGFIPAGLPSFNANKVKGYYYNINKAQQLLKEAGFEGGKNFPEISLETTQSYSDMASLLQKEWENLGIKVNISLTPPAFLREKMSKGEAIFFRGSWIADYPDAESYLAVLYGKNPAPPNYTRFKNKQFDAWYEKALLENNINERNTLYQKMDSLAIAEVPLIPLYYDEVLRFTQKNIEGLGINAINLLSLKQVNIK